MAEDDDERRRRRGGVVGAVAVAALALLGVQLAGQPGRGQTVAVPPVPEAVETVEVVEAVETVQDPPPMSRGERAHALLQQRFDATNHVLDAYLQERPLSRYAGARTEYDTETLRVFWQGEPPRDLVTALDAVPGGVAVLFAPARYSQAELDRARDVLLPPRLVDSPLHALGITVATGSLLTDGSGLRLTIVVEPPGAPVDLDRARRAVRDLVDVPVEVVAGQPVIPARGWAGAAGGRAAA